MQSTQQRQAAILDLVSTRPITGQEELLALLRERGIPTTQATLSRDLKALRIVKLPGEGYVRTSLRNSDRSDTETGSGVLGIDISGQLAVIKTRPGFASAVASFIDRHHVEPVMGTVAGDDTVLVVLRVGATPGAALDALSRGLPDIAKKMYRI